MVAEAPELDDELDDELAPELELELDPHAATTSAATIAIAPALMRRLFNVFSFSIWRECLIAASVGPAARARVNEL
jgi:hypothetical protein